MGVIDTLASGVFADIFLGDEFFAEDVVFWPEGDGLKSLSTTTRLNGQSILMDSGRDEE